ncbi:MAG: XrtA system polysaccharide chain length determinant [Granulosicoccaceae bacterium]
MSNITLDEMGPLLSREAAARRGTLLAIFTTVALLFLLLAFTWQNKYASFVQLYVDDSNIIKPILNAQTGLSRDQANVAKEELFSAEIMDRILVEVGLVPKGSGVVARARVKEDVINNTVIGNINNQLIQIKFQHTDPRIAFETVKMYADLFLAKTMRSSAAETSDAFDFILDQVETYRDRLEDAEKRLESFRGQYPGVSATTEGNVDARIIELRRQLEESQLQFTSANQRRISLERELNSESSTLAQDYQAGQIRSQVSALQSQMDVLMLSYTADYPDVVRIRQQISDLTELAVSGQSRAQQQNSAGGNSTFNLGGTSYSGANNLSPVYQQLRSDLARTTANADSTRSRIGQLKVMLEKEITRAAQSSRVERQLTELSRDYQINKELYEDLLRRQESARLSMSLGSEKQGVLYRIHEPAFYPILPTGMRFLHIATIGFIIATLLPILYLIVFLKLDPRIRTASAVTELLELPLLTTVPHIARPDEKSGFFSQPRVVALMVFAVVGLYIGAAVLKFIIASSAQGGGIA